MGKRLVWNCLENFLNSEALLFHIRNIIESLANSYFLQFIGIQNVYSTIAGWELNLVLLFVWIQSQGKPRYVCKAHKVKVKQLWWHEELSLEQITPWNQNANWQGLFGVLRCSEVKGFLWLENVWHCIFFYLCSE